MAEDIQFDFRWNFFAAIIASMLALNGFMRLAKSYAEFRIEQDGEKAKAAEKKPRETQSFDVADFKRRFSCDDVLISRLVAAGALVDSTTRKITILAHTDTRFACKPESDKAVAGSPGTLSEAAASR